MSDNPMLPLVQRMMAATVQFMLDPIGDLMFNGVATNVFRGSVHPSGQCLLTCDRIEDHTRISLSPSFESGLMSDHSRV